MQYIKSSTYFDTWLNAVVHITVRSTSKSLKARIVGTEYRISVPELTPVDVYRKFVCQIAEKLGSRLKEVQEKRMFRPGLKLEGLMLSVEVMGSDKVPSGKINIEFRKGNPCTLKYYINPLTDLKTIQKPINSHILKEAKNIAKTFFQPYVWAKARELGMEKEIKSIDFNANRSNYGLCYRNGRIEFSSRIIFMPYELRELIVCHEIAHLTYHDHSPQFHALLDSYLGGRERELEKALRNFESPLF